ncbi:MAG: hypothetical protein IJX76_00895 [Clostridia bacterium]|nr:hypothetical protein [Clostridia bacterium]
MKKFAILLAALMLTLPLASCSSTEDTTPTTVADGTTTPAPATTTATPTTEKPATEDPSTTTKNPILDKVTTDAPETNDPDVTDDPDTPDTPDTPDGFTVGNADELIAAIDSINSGESPEDTNITLTADIDMTGLAGAGDYEPLYRYSGTFDGAGHTIKNLNWKFIMANGGNTNMPLATEVYSYVIENTDPDGNNQADSGCFARGTVALLVLQLNEGGTVKDLTLSDSSMTIDCSYNKNYQMFFGGVVGYLNGGSVEGVTLANVDITIPANVNYNQGFTGYAAPVVGRVSGDSAVTDCVVGSDCTVDASANVMFNTGTLVGVLEADSSVDADGSSSQAECKVHLNPTKDVLAYKGDGITLGGVAGGLIGTDLTK